MGLGITPPKRGFNHRSGRKTYSVGEIARFMDDLYQVGPEKPVGYLPLDTISSICRRDIGQVQAELEGRGLKTLLLREGAGTNVGSGALYAWDEDALKKKLESGKDILAPVGLSTNCEDYIRSIARYTYCVHPVFGFISETFGKPFKHPHPGTEEYSNYPGAQNPPSP